MGGQGVGVGEDVDEEAGGDPVGAGVGGAGGVAALAGQGGGVDGQCAEGVGAALRLGAGVVVADGVDQGVDRGLEEGGVVGGQSAPDAGGAGGVVGVADGEVAAAGGVAGAAHRGGVVALHGGVDGLFELVLRQGSPVDGLFGEVGVQGGQRVVVGDQGGAPGDGVHGAGGQVAGQEQGADVGEAVAQGDGEVHLSAGAAVADGQGAGEFGGAGVPVVAGPVGVFVGAAAGHQFGDPGESAGVGGGGGPGPILDSGDQRGVGQPAQRVGTGHRPIEHMCDSIGAGDNKHRSHHPLWTKAELWIQPEAAFAHGEFARQLGAILER